ISTPTRLRWSSLFGLVVLALVDAAVICGWCTMPNAKGRRRRFGAVRRLPSGRFQARYPGPDGVTRPADDTFETKTEAEVWLARKEAEIFDGDWLAPAAGRAPPGECGAAGTENPPGPPPNTTPFSPSPPRSHTAPPSPAMTVAELKIEAVRRWRKKLLDNGVSPVTTAKAYRL